MLTDGLSQALDARSLVSRTLPYLLTKFRLCPCRLCRLWDISALSKGALTNFTLQSRHTSIPTVLLKSRCIHTHGWPTFSISLVRPAKFSGNTKFFNYLVLAETDSKQCIKTYELCVGSDCHVNNWMFFLTINRRIVCSPIRDFTPDLRYQSWLMWVCVSGGAECSAHTDLGS